MIESNDTTTAIRLRIQDKLEFLECQNYGLSVGLKVAALNQKYSLCDFRNRHDNSYMFGLNYLKWLYYTQIEHRLNYYRLTRYHQKRLSCNRHII